MFAPPVAETAASLGVDERGEPVYPPGSIVRSVSRVGQVGFQKRQITVGVRWAGARVRVIPLNGLVHIYYGEEVVRVLAVDPTRYNQPLLKEVKPAAAVR